ncbi:MAG: GDP-mannose 4,6-dehydratase [Pseudomonadota bacterium]
MTKARVLIFGLSGQDGTYLSQLVDQLDHDLIILDQSIDFNQSPQQIEHELEAVLIDQKPTHVFNLAALATGAGMFDNAYNMININGYAVVSILEAIRKSKLNIKFCQAGSSEMFGLPNTSPQNELTAFNPRTPYGAAKLLAHNMVNIYRKHYGIFACSAILFNHESPIRSNQFVTRKVTQAAVKIKLGLQEKLTIGALDTRRDWGYAPDYAKAMWLMLQQQEADDFVIATGITHSIRDLCKIAFEYLDLDYQDYVEVDLSFKQRAIEGLQLVGDSTKARKILHWTPSIPFKEMIQEMVISDLNMLKTQEIVAR